jgi:alpha-beta hydrolase superfamily lysophospholipase
MNMSIRAKLIATTAAILLLGAGAAASAQTPMQAAAEYSTVRLRASAGRELEVRVWPAENPEAVIVFSAGGGGEPAAYDRLMRVLAQEGFTVVAPVHRDPLARGDLSGAGGPQSFIMRVEDLSIARGYAEAMQAGLPLVVMGHSFGSLMSSLAAGASTPAGAQGAPNVKALVAFSSPGLIPGLVSPATYRSLGAPVLMVTGDRDVVQGFATDWRDHRAMYDQSTVPGSAFAVFEGADHSLVVDGDETTFAELTKLTTTFIRANALGDPRARAELSAMEPPGATIERR